MRILFSTFLFGFIWIEKFFFLKYRRYSTLKRLIGELINVGISVVGVVMLIKWLLNLRVETLRVDFIIIIIMVIVIEIGRVLRRAEKKYDSLKNLRLPSKEVYKRFIAIPIPKLLFQPTVEERIEPAKKVN